MKIQFAELISFIKKVIQTKQQLIKEPIKWTHVRGHQKQGGVDMIWNNYVDKLATNESSMIL